MSAIQPTACMILIGNELLSGRTQDKNLHWLAGKLGEQGIAMKRAHVVPDDEAEIIATVNEARQRYDVVFTTGGIGPTHDDITTEAIAKAFGVPVLRHAEAERRLRAHYPAEMVNEARLKMADIPEGAVLIDNPVSAAPGYMIGNVCVLAGVPSIMQGMFAHLKELLPGGVPTFSAQLCVWAPEGTLAERLGAIAAAYPQAEIGCYPLIRGGRIGASLVARSTDADIVAHAINACRELSVSLGAEIAEDEPS